MLQQCGKTKIYKTTFSEIFFTTFCSDDSSSLVTTFVFCVPGHLRLSHLQHNAAALHVWTVREGGAAMGKKSKGGKGGRGSKGGKGGKGGKGANARGEDTSGAEEKTPATSFNSTQHRNSPLSVSYDTEQALTLPLEEQTFLRNISLDASQALNDKSIADEIITRATEILQRYHMVILHGVLSKDDVATLHCDYRTFLDFSGDAAIREKDASKRSGTRLYNCACQVGPACKFRGWKQGSDGSKHVLHPEACEANAWDASPRVWERIVNHFGFRHVARVEVVTSHAGCRHQAWHSDGERGLTVIFPLVSVDLRKGPTQMDFTVPFNNLYEGRGKVKKRDASAPKSARAAMPMGSVVMFNANMSHRGTANLTRGDRPILVLDCSPACEHEKESIWAL